MQRITSHNTPESTEKNIKERQIKGKREKSLKLKLVLTCVTFYSFASFSLMHRKGFRMYELLESERHQLVMPPLSFGQYYDKPPFGFVFRDLTRRILSRKITNSNILVFAKDASSGVQMAQYAMMGGFNKSKVVKFDSMHFQSPFSIGGTLALHAASEGHTVHAVDFDSKNSVSLDEWWKSIQNVNIWILMAIIDLEFGDEDLAWQSSNKFLSQSTVTYMVTSVHSTIRNGTCIMGGLHAVRSLLKHHYKIQILTVSHYHVKPGDEPRIHHLYGPNALLKSTQDVRNLLNWGASGALHFDDSQSGAVPVFTAYLFATQGLDLAIPSPRIYLDDASRVKGSESQTQVNLYKPIVYKLCPKALVKTDLINFGFNSRGSLKLTIRQNGSMWYPYKSVPIKGLHVTTNLFAYFGSPKVVISNKMALSSKTTKKNQVLIWHDHADLTQSEAACARYKDMVHCTTRILRRETKNPRKSIKNKPNLLLIMLDPMSRGAFCRMMPQTKKVLETMGLFNFQNYSVVGDNSGPNQHALYSGLPLMSRDSIGKNDKSKPKWLWDNLEDAGYVTLKVEDGCIANSNMIQSIEPQTTHGKGLNQMFCFDHDRPNCIGKELAASHVLQHGQQFMASYGNVGSKFTQPWAAFMHFVDSHEDSMFLSGVVDSLIANFLDSRLQDESLNNTFVVVTSDHGLHYGPYFQSKAGQRERSEPILYMGMARGGFPLSIAMKENTKRWTTPFDVYMTLTAITNAKKEIGFKGNGLSLLRPLPPSRSECLSTELIPDKYCPSHAVDLKGECELLPRPPSILSFFADVPRSKRPRPGIGCLNLKLENTKLLTTPVWCQCATSHRDWHNCSEFPWSADSENASLDVEYFAMFKCDENQMQLKTRILPQKNMLERFDHATKVKTKASKRPPNILFLEIDSVSRAYAERHFPETIALLEKHRRQISGQQHAKCFGGLCAAEFKKFAVAGPNSIANQVPALSGCLVARYHESCIQETYIPDKCAIIGQFHSKDGCSPCPKGNFLKDTMKHCDIKDDGIESCCTNSFPRHDPSQICDDDSQLERNLQLFRRGPRRATTWCPPPTTRKQDSASLSPFLFDVAKVEGYITYFGEEFCYEDSLYVAQDNIFPLESDFLLHKAFCRIATCKNYRGPQISENNITGPYICADHETANGVNSTLAFAQISAIWDAYPNVPKFAFLNSLAAHDYSFDWINMIAGSEEYDHHLAFFLEYMFSRNDADNTIIILRTDHGLQGGPTTVEYSVQVEHREPWTEIIFPEEFGGLSLDAIEHNQNALSTGYDLYNTLRKLMDYSSREEKAPIPDWSFDLLNEKIPMDRSCNDAKIPPDFCPCDDGNGLGRAPNFGICNTYDPYNDLYCVDGDEIILPAELEL